MAAIVNWIESFGNQPITIKLKEPPHPSLATSVSPNVATFDGRLLYLHPRSLEEAIALGEALRTFVWPDVPENGYVIVSALCMIDMITYIGEGVDNCGGLSDDQLLDRIHRSGYRISRQEFDALMIGYCTEDSAVLGRMLAALCESRRRPTKRVRFE